MNKGSSFPDGTDGENNNVEEVEIWERLSIIPKDIDTLIDIPIAHPEEGNGSNWNGTESKNTTSSQGFDESYHSQVSHYPEEIETWQPIRRISEGSEGETLEQE